MAVQHHKTDIRPQLSTLIGSKPPYAWAAAVGIPKGSFFKIWNNGVAPQMQHLLQIAEKEGVTLDWLMTGMGQMYRGKDFTDGEKAPGGDGQTSHEYIHPNCRNLFPDRFDSDLFRKIAKTVDRLIEKSKVDLPPKKIGDINMLAYADAYWRGKNINEEFISFLIGLAS